MPRPRENLLFIFIDTTNQRMSLKYAIPINPSTFDVPKNSRKSLSPNFMAIINPKMSITQIVKIVS